MADKKITIIGLGLIGGSLARAFHERTGISDITAVSRSAEPMRQAMKDGVISRGFEDINEYVLESDIIFICTPVNRLTEYIMKLAGKVKKSCIVTDVGSTKAEITRFINNMPGAPCFIGGHPMAGTEKTGYSASFSHLFENAYYILTPSKSSTEEAINYMTELVKTIGAIPVTLDADLHDRITGTISHIPHIVASALVNIVKESDTPDGKMQLLAAGGFKDITRIASSSPEIWESIIMSNMNHVDEILQAYINALEKFRMNLRAQDANRIYDFFETARQYRNSFTDNRKGLIPQAYEIIADVIDKPGIIGEIATILGNSGINIKNINISNSRELEQGCLKITFSDSKSANIAFDLLKLKGYKVYKR